MAAQVGDCLWYGCPEHYMKPKGRCEYWAGKLRENVERDLGRLRS